MGPPRNSHHIVYAASSPVINPMTRKTDPRFKKNGLKAAPDEQSAACRRDGAFPHKTGMGLSLGPVFSHSTGVGKRQQHQVLRLKLA